METSQNIFKLPLFYFIYYYSEKTSAEKSDYKNTKNFIFLYYFYSFLFSKTDSSKNRNYLPHSLIKSIGTNSCNIEFVKTIKKIL